MKFTTSVFTTLTLLTCLSAYPLFAQTNEFTYQGQLRDNSLPPTANYDFVFSLYDSLVGGSQVGTTNTPSGVAVVNGIFTVRLNFGNLAGTSNLYLQISARPSSGGAYTLLTPRQQLTSSPLALKSARATSAENVTGVVAIANGGTGSSTKNFVDLSTDQLSINGRKAFSNLETIEFDAVTARFSDQITVGPFGGSFSSVVRDDYVKSHRVDARSFSVENQTILEGLSADAGLRLGIDTGFTIPGFSTILGNRAGRANGATATGGVFVGYEAGEANTFGDQNTFVGYRSGETNTNGFINTFVGSEAGRTNVSGSRNTAIGWRADVGSGGLTNATAIGAGAVVTTSNTVMLGRSTDTVVMPNLVLLPTLAAFSPLGGNTTLCRNALNQISNCPPPPAGLSGDLDQLQAENRELREELRRQRATTDALKALVCSQNAQADVCKKEQ